MSYGRTIALPLCKEHPPLNAWPMRNLITGVCPRCGGLASEDPHKAARALRARRLLRERGL